MAQKNTETEAEMDLEFSGGTTKFSPRETLSKHSQSQIEDMLPDSYFDMSEEFTELQLEDYTWKVRSRKNYGWVLVGLLIAQNLAVFTLVFIALRANRLEESQLIFSVLVGSTLLETAYMVKVIVEWLFKDINYPLPS